MFQYINSKSVGAQRAAPLGWNNSIGRSMLRPYKHNLIARFSCLNYRDGSFNQISFENSVVPSNRRLVL